MINKTKFLYFLFLSHVSNWSVEFKPEESLKQTNTMFGNHYARLNGVIEVDRKGEKRKE